MHNHNNNSNKNDGHKGMWWMMIPCILLLGFLFFGGGNLSSSGYLWPILIGVFIVAHIWMMFKGHGRHSDTNTEEKSDATLEKSNIPVKNKDNKHSGGCCH